MKKIISMILALTIGIALFIGWGQKIKEAPNNIVDATTQSARQLESYVDEIYSKVQSNWKGMGSVWPGLDYTKHDLILFKLDEEGKTQRAWAINTEGKKELTEEEFSKLQAPSPLNYGKLTFNGRESFSMSIDDMALTIKDLVPEVYNTATHELVHFYYQPELESDGIESRSTKYPLDYKPRMYRKMIIQNLVQAFQSDEYEKSLYLGRVKYWLEKWKNEYNDEYKTIKNIDIFEGSARYIEYLGARPTKKVTEEELKNYYISKLEKNVEYSAADGESYELGYISGLLLDQIKPDWKINYYDTGLTPVELVVSNYKAVEEKVDNQVESKLKKSMDEVNKQISKDMDNIIKSENDISIPYLKINDKNMVGSMGLEGFYNYKGKEILLKLDCSFESSEGDIKPSGLSAISKFENGSNYIMIPVTLEYKLNGSRLQINTENMNADVKVKETKDEQGRVVFVVE